MARILLFSDSHGVFAAMQALRARVEADAPDLVCFLGDALYHGPRNGVPLDYDTKASAEAFNAMAERIVAVRGNCDAEIDQYMLSFPMLGTYATVVADGIRLFLSHGHLWGPDEQLPPLPAGAIVATGHTHVPTVERVHDLWCPRAAPSHPTRSSRTGTWKSAASRTAESSAWRTWRNA